MYPIHNLKSIVTDIIILLRHNVFMEGVIYMSKQQNFDNIIQIIDNSFDEIMLSIISDLESNEQYKDLMFSEGILLDDYSYLKDLKQIKELQLDEEKIQGILFFIEHLEKKMTIMMKGAYFRGIKDNTLLLQQAGLFNPYKSYLDK